MKLSTLIEHRNTVAAVNFSEYIALGQKISDVSDMLERYGTELAHGTVNQLAPEAILIETQVEKMDSIINEYLVQIERQILELEPEWLAASDLVYQDIKYDNAEWTLNRLKNVEEKRSTTASKLLLDRISIYPTWEHTAMQVHPGFGFATELLKGSDPLYFVDTREDLFDVIKEKWNPMYQNRLRYYVIDEFTKEKRFAKLPKEQFGFILALDYFTYRTVDVLTEYLTEFYNLLKPGGVAFFTFNNCDVIEGCRLLEHKFACYATEKMVKSIVDNLGYEMLHFEVVTECGTSWIEIKKPGTLKTLRGGQTVSQIKSI